MGPPQRRRSTKDDNGATVLGQFATIGVVLVMVLSVTAGMAAAADRGPVAQQEMPNETYAVAQGEDCTEVTPFSGNESVKSFYDYRTPYENNTYTNRTGRSYSSKGTVTLQRPDASALFLYEDRAGNLSLVMVHGSADNGSDGGSATFTITGLSEDGEWAVKDDEYDGEDNYDVWQSADGVHHVDWTWGPEKTDGGAYTGLGEEFNVTIDPAFNTEAGLYGEHYNGTVRYWSALSDGGEDYERTSLTAQPVTISSEGC